MCQQKVQMISVTEYVTKFPTSRIPLSQESHVMLGQSKQLDGRFRKWAISLPLHALPFFTVKCVI